MSTPSVIYVFLSRLPSATILRRREELRGITFVIFFSCFFLVEGVPGMAGKRGDQGKPGRQVSYLGVNAFSAEH